MDQTNFESVDTAAIFTTNEIKWIHLTKGVVQLKGKISDSFKKATDINARLNYTNAIMCSSSN